MYNLEKYICKELYEDLKNAANDPCFDQVAGQRVLITGGGGFIAYYLALTLLALNDEKERGNTVYLLVRNENRAKARYGELLNRNDLKLVIQDVCQKFDFDGQQFDYIIHAASSADAKHFEEDPIGVFNSNVIGTENVIQFCLKNQQCKSIVYISSFTVYGQIAPELEEITEDYCGADPWNSNRSCYSQGKRSAEFLCMAAHRKNGLPIRIVRPGFVYGSSSPDDNRVYAEIIRNVALQQPVVLQSAGLFYRSMIYVTDLVRAIFSVLFCGRDGEAYNAASEHISIRQFAECAVNAANNEKTVLVFKNEEDKNAAIPSVIKGSMSTQKMKEHCNWSPKVGVTEGIRMGAEIYNYIYNGNG